jgi:hypothetical protein
MKLHRSIPFVLLFGFAAAVFIRPAPIVFSQDDMTMVPVSAFDTLERPRVVFAHDDHNEKAGIEDCVLCHHSATAEGLMDMETSSEGEPCESCHPVEATGDKTPLMRAYHRQCGDCHAESLKGPVACGECHAK